MSSGVECVYGLDSPLHALVMFGVSALLSSTRRRAAFCFFGEGVRGRATKKTKIVAGSGASGGESLCTRCDSCSFVWRRELRRVQSLDACEHANYKFAGRSFLKSGSVLKLPVFLMVFGTELPFRSTLCVVANCVSSVGLFDKL